MTTQNNDGHHKRFDFNLTGLPVFMTLGEFVSLLIDNRDEAICIQEMESRAIDEGGYFSQELRIVLLPPGQVIAEVSKHQNFKMSKVLKELTQKGIVK